MKKVLLKILAILFRLFHTKVVSEVKQIKPEKKSCDEEGKHDSKSDSIS